MKFLRRLFCAMLLVAAGIVASIYPAAAQWQGEAVAGAETLAGFGGKLLQDIGHDVIVSVASGVLSDKILHALKQQSESSPSALSAPKAGFLPGGSAAAVNVSLTRSFVGTLYTPAPSRISPLGHLPLLSGASVRQAPAATQTPDPAVLARFESPEIQNAVGLHYITSAPADFERAFQWFEAAAAQHYPPALYNLGRMYFYGYGVVRPDARRAADLNYQAASGNAVYPAYAPAEMAMALMLSNLDSPLRSSLDPERLVQYDDAAMEWLARAYSAGFPSAAGNAAALCGQRRVSYAVGSRYCNAAWVR